MRLLRSSKAALALALVFVLVAGHLAQPGPPTDDEEDADVEEASGQMDDQQTDAGFTDTAVFDRRPASSTTAPVVDADAEDLGTEDAGDDDDDDLSLDSQPGNQGNTDSDGTAGVMAPSKEIVPAYESSSTPPQVTYQSTRSKLLAIISKPGILAGIVGGAVIGILTAILLIMFIVYRMRKKDEGSYALEETKKPLSAYDYRHCPTKEFYA